MAWGDAATSPKTTSSTKVNSTEAYGKDYYRDLFSKAEAQSSQYRFALVGHENTAKTGLAASLLEKEMDNGEIVYVLDVDNSAKATLEYLYPNNKNLRVIPLHDEMDDSIFHEDNSVNYKALVDKTTFFVNEIARRISEDDEKVGGIIFDGGSTFLKWCEFAMRQSLLAKGIIENEDDSFNQKEWRERNRLNRDVLTRIHALPVNKIFYTFHLKGVQQYMDDGTGKKVLMTVGERPDWERGTMRKFNQQIFLSRYMKKADMAAGVKGDRTLNDGEWSVRGTIEEMKGANMEYVGSTHEILAVKNGAIEWFGLPFLKEE